MDQENNRRAFLDMISHSEGTFGRGDNGYNVLVGGDLFFNYDDHPRRIVKLPRRGQEPIYSTAAGRYQLLARYFDFYKKKLNLTDFSPSSQDAIALQQIKECKALDDVDAGRIDQAIKKCARIWASLPGAGYGQPEKKIEFLLAAYTKAGGTLA